MEKVKIIDGFHEPKKAEKLQNHYAKVMKKRSATDAKVVVEDGYTFYMRHEWYKKQRRFKTKPAPGQKIVVIYYYQSEEVVAANKETVVVAVMPKVRSTFAVLMPSRAKTRKGVRFSPMVLIDIEFPQLLKRRIEKASKGVDSKLYHRVAA